MATRSIIYVCSIVPRALYNSYVDHWLLLFAVYQDPTGDGYNVY